MMNVAEYHGLSAYHINNLETLAAFLKSDDIPPPVFDISGYAFTKDRQKTLALLGISSGEDEFDGFGIGDNGHIYKPSLMTTEVYSSCGTTACAIGHGPLAGIPVKPNETWAGYETRVFGMTMMGVNGRVWRFLFAAEWTQSHLNNTAKGSAARIDYFLKHGVPNFYFSEVDDSDRPWFKGLDTSTFIVPTT